MVKFNNILAVICLAIAAVGCDKVSPTGILIAGTSVDDRVKQSYTYYKDMDKKEMWINNSTKGEYSFVVGADSHTTDDLNRLKEFFNESLKTDKNYLFCAHLGDLAETKPEYYQNVDTLVDGYVERNPGKFRFYPVVGNHDVTHNGWAMFTKIFGSSSYPVLVQIKDLGEEEGPYFDLMLFLDSANGTFGEIQIREIIPEYFKDRSTYRHCFVFSHTNFFRPRKNAFSSILPREELYHMLGTFSENNVNTVFCGHIHMWDDRTYGGVRYITLDALSADNSPERGQIEVVTCKADGSIDYETRYVK